MIKRTVTENPLRLTTKYKNVFSKFLFALETEWQTHGFLVNCIQPNPNQEKLFLFGFPYYLMQRKFFITSLHQTSQFDIWIFIRKPPFRKLVLK